MKVRILVTGGTFDKDYDEIGGKLYFAETRVPEMLALGRCGLQVEVQTLMLIDSLDMTDADRPAHRRGLPATPSERIVDHPRHRHHGADGPGAGAGRRWPRPSC